MNTPENTPERKPEEEGTLEPAGEEENRRSRETNPKRNRSRKTSSKPKPRIWEVKDIESGEMTPEIQRQVLVKYLMDRAAARKSARKTYATKAPMERAAKELMRQNEMLQRALEARTEAKKRFRKAFLKFKHRDEDENEEAGATSDHANMVSEHEEGQEEEDDDAIVDRLFAESEIYTNAYNDAILNEEEAFTPLENN